MRGNTASKAGHAQKRHGSPVRASRAHLGKVAGFGAGRAGRAHHAGHEREAAQPEGAGRSPPRLLSPLGPHHRLAVRPAPRLTWPRRRGAGAHSRSAGDVMTNRTGPGPEGLSLDREQGGLRDCIRDLRWSPAGVVGRERLGRSSLGAPCILARPRPPFAWRRALTCRGSGVAASPWRALHTHPQSRRGVPWARRSSEPHCVFL